jgi:Family of unknown function (DUF6302)
MPERTRTRKARLERREAYRVRGAADVMNREYYEERLDDVTLLDGAVTVTVESFADIAVPVGGKRRGGCFDTFSWRQAHDVVRQLVGRPGFPNVRVVHHPDFQAWVVEWGEPEPHGDATDVGRHFGYSEAAILEFNIQHIFKPLTAEDLETQCAHCVAAHSRN